METKLWCDLKTDEERLEFLESGRAVSTGIIAPAIVEDVIRAFECLNLCGHLRRSQ